jgi:hypothetical protein
VSEITNAWGIQLIFSKNQEPTKIKLINQCNTTMLRAIKEVALDLETLKFRIWLSWLGKPGGWVTGHISKYFMTPFR